METVDIREPCPYMPKRNGEYPFLLVNYLSLPLQGVFFICNIFIT